jgi:hypothetical protein
LETGYDVTTDKYDNVYFTGVFRGSNVNFAKDWNGADLKSTIEESQNRIFVTKILSDGSYGWTKAIGGESYYSPQACNSIKLDSECNIYLSGAYGADDWDDKLNFAADWGMVDRRSTFGFGDYFIMKINNDCSYGFVKTYGWYSYDSGSCIDIDSFGNLYSLCNMRLPFPNSESTYQSLLFIKYAP